MWMLFHAVHKETKEAVCVHILHKEKIPKAQRDSEPFLELMRREANQLVRVRIGDRPISFRFGFSLSALPFCASNALTALHFSFEIC